MRRERDWTRILRRLQRRALAFDAAANAWLYESNQGLRAAYASFSTFMDRFRVSGARRIATELAAESANLGTFGAILLLFLAIPAFRETSEDWLKRQDLAVTFLDRNGQEVGRRGIRQDDSVNLDQLPDHLIRAVLATEDRRFFEHWGVDPIGSFRALAVNARSSGVVQGGSTITQQLAKNLFLTNERTLERKIKEAFLALWLESRLTKREILKLYLDRAYMGGGAFGVQAASEFYFGKSARDVTLAEAAMLAGLFKAPTKYAPHINLPAARARAGDVLHNLVNAGFLTDMQIYPALRNPATPVERPPEISPDWYLDWAYGEIKALSESGKLGADRVLTVRLALDPTLQAHAEEVVETQLREHGRAAHAKQAALVVMEPQTGALRAIVGGRDYGTSQFNRASDAMRQPGSSFKPYVYLAAIDSGKFQPSTIVVDRPVCIGNWCPRNYGGSFAGSVPLAVALAKSLNTVAVQLSIALGDPKLGVYESARMGRARIIETARKMGVTAPLVDTVSLPIGAAEIALLEHSASYAVFANGGYRIKPFAAIEVRNSRGAAIYRQDQNGVQPVRVFSERSIIQMNSMLTKVVEDGTARRAGLGEAIKVGGKTGTTNGYKDAWFCGFTGNFNGCVWFGNDDDSPMNNITGGSLPAQTWRDVMELAHRNVEARGLPGYPLASANSEAAAPGAIKLQPSAMSRRSHETIVLIERLLSNDQQIHGGSIVPPAGSAAASSAAHQETAERGVGSTGGFVVIR